MNINDLTVEPRNAVLLHQSYADDEVLRKNINILPFLKDYGYKLLVFKNTEETAKIANETERYQKLIKRAKEVGIEIKEIEAADLDELLYLLKHSEEFGKEIEYDGSLYFLYSASCYVSVVSSIMLGLEAKLFLANGYYQDTRKNNSEYYFCVFDEVDKDFFNKHPKQYTGAFNCDTIVDKFYRVPKTYIIPNDITEYEYKIDGKTYSGKIPEIRSEFGEQGFTFVHTEPNENGFGKEIKHRIKIWNSNEEIPAYRISKIDDMIKTYGENLYYAKNGLNSNERHGLALENVSVPFALVYTTIKTEDNLSKRIYIGVAMEDYSDIEGTQVNNYSDYHEKLFNMPSLLDCMVDMQVHSFLNRDLYHNILMAKYSPNTYCFDIDSCGYANYPSDALRPRFKAFLPKMYDNRLLNEYYYSTINLSYWAACILGFCFATNSKENKICTDETYSIHNIAGVSKLKDETYELISKTHPHVAEALMVTFNHAFPTSLTRFMTALDRDVKKMPFKSSFSDIMPYITVDGSVLTLEEDGDTKVYTGSGMAGVVKGGESIPTITATNETEDDDSARGDYPFTIVKKDEKKVVVFIKNGKELTKPDSVTTTETPLEKPPVEMPPVEPPVETPLEEPPVDPDPVEPKANPEEPKTDPPQEVPLTVPIEKPNYKNEFKEYHYPNSPIVKLYKKTIQKVIYSIMRAILGYVYTTIPNDLKHDPNYKNGNMGILDFTEKNISHKRLRFSWRYFSKKGLLKIPYICAAAFVGMLIIFAIVIWFLLRHGEGGEASNAVKGFIHQSARLISQSMRR